MLDKFAIPDIEKGLFVQNIVDHPRLAPMPTTIGRSSQYANGSNHVLIDIPEEEKLPIQVCWRLCCPCYYLFCCCCCCESGMKVTKMRFIQRFKKWIPSQKRLADFDVRDPVGGLIKLYAHQQGAIQDLRECRINPDFNSTIRNDLEFFIPQLCCIYLHGEIDEADELADLMLACAKSSIFFSHRIRFFFRSLIFTTTTDEGKRQSRSADDMLKQLERICIETEELLCLMSSRELLLNIVKFGMA